MKKAEEDIDEMRPGYVRSDFGEIVRGKYAAKLNSVVLITLDSDVAAAFPDSRAVNDALRSLLNAPNVKNEPV